MINYFFWKFIAMVHGVVRLILYELPTYIYIYILRERAIEKGKERYSFWIPCLAYKILKSKQRVPTRVAISQCILFIFPALRIDIIYFYYFGWISDTCLSFHCHPQPLHCIMISIQPPVLQLPLPSPLGVPSDSEIFHFLHQIKELPHNHLIQIPQPP